MDVQALLRLYENDQTERAIFDTHWEDAGAYVWPNHKDFTSQNVTQGAKKNLHLYTDTATTNAKKYAAVLEALLSRRSTKWHRLSAKDETLRKIPRVRKFYDAVAEDLFAVREAEGSACYEALSTCYRAEGVFGNDALWVDEKVDRLTGKREGIRYRALPVRDVFVGRGWQDEIVRAFVRYELAAAELPEKFGEERIPARWLEKAKSKPTERANLVTALTLNPAYDPRSPFSRPWSVHEILVDERTAVREEASAYHELPLIYTSAERAPSEIYGRSIAMDVLPTVKTLNEMMKAALRSAEKGADPPLLVRDDGVLGVSRAVRLRPGGLTRGGIDKDGRPMVQALHTGASIAGIVDLLEYFERKLDRHFLVDVFTLLVERSGKMTAREIAERSAEKGVFLGPVVGGHQGQKLAPMVRREIGIRARQGALPEPPGELLEAGIGYQLIYETPAQQLQRAGEVEAIEATIASAVPLGEIDRRALLLFDMGKVSRKLAELRGFPGELMRSEREVEQEAQAAAQEAARAEAQATLPDRAKALRDVAQAEAAAGAAEA